MKNSRLKTVLWMSGVLCLSGCQTLLPDLAIFERIDQTLETAATPVEAEAEVPPQIASKLLPPLTVEAAQPEKEHRFDLAVNDAPAAEVFLGIVSGTRYSMLVHPEVSGQISVNLKDTTVFEALKALRSLYGYEYQLDGNHIYILKPGLTTKLYRINYIVGQRKGRSDISVTAGGGGSSDSTTDSAGGGGGQSQVSSVQSMQEGNFWQEVENSVKAVLTCSGGSGNSNNSDQQQAQSSCADNTVLVNPMSGTVFVRAAPDQIRVVDEMLDAMQVNIARQVILEAKIIDVELNSGAQQGINWAGFRHGAHHASVGADTSKFVESSGNGGSLEAGATLGDMLGSGLSDATGSAFSAGLGMALQVNEFSALINFLQTQGAVNVLSSPRISTVNNQKAVLKIGRDEQFVTGFEGAESSTTTTGGTVNSQPTPVYSTFFSGISLDVTPQIDENGVITLHVHPLVSEVTEVMKRTVNNAFLPFASNKISETDSVVRVGDGEIVVIGGLMTESNLDTRNQVTGLGKLPLIGALFRKLDRGTRKRELVILLRPTVVKGAHTWGDDIGATRERIQRLSQHTEQALQSPVIVIEPDEKEL